MLTPDASLDLLTTMRADAVFLSGMGRKEHVSDLARQLRDAREWIRKLTDPNLVGRRHSKLEMQALARITMATEARAACLPETSE